MPVTILGIESSCDETAAAVLIDGQLISNITADQSVHAQYGGVVPELASRAHQANIVPVVYNALETAGISLRDLSGIAFTRGPGLLGSLMVGAGYAKGVALALNIPLMAVHHMKAHILAHFIEDPKPAFPFLCLTVSGGHTQIVLVKAYNDMEVLGQTIDDAAGEAFDKAAKMMGIPYPGGPRIDTYAESGDAHAYSFAKTQVPGLHMSFSGHKTSILYFLRDMEKKEPGFTQLHLQDLCASVRKSIVDMLMEKLILAAEQTGIDQIALAGGVSANALLRARCMEWGTSNGKKIYIPDLAYCTDNAAMIAMAGYFQYIHKDFAPADIAPVARWPF